MALFDFEYVVNHFLRDMVASDEISPDECRRAMLFISGPAYEKAYKLATEAIKKAEAIEEARVQAMRACTPEWYK